MFGLLCGLFQSATLFVLCVRLLEGDVRYSCLVKSVKTRKVILNKKKQNITVYS